MSSAWFKRAGPLALVIALLLVLASEPPFVFGLRHALFDGYQRLFPRERISAPAVIVAIDEQALERHGQWPWPRTRVAQLLAGISDAGPAAIGVDLLFAEPDRFSPAEVAREVQELSVDVARRLRALPSNDAALAAALKARAVVLGIAGLEAPDPRFERPPAAAPIRITDGADFALRRFAGHLQSLPEIDRAAAGRGLLSVDPEGNVIRRALAAARIGDVIVPALSVEMLRVATGAPLALIARGRDQVEVRLGDIAIPAHADGRFWIRYGPHDPARFVSAAQVLEGSVAAPELQDKLVLVGVTGLGLLDYQTTALGERIPGAEIHAQILEQIFDGAFLRRPSTLHALELGLLAVAALMFALTVPSLGVATSIALYAVVIALLTALGIEGFLLEGLLLDVAWPAIGATVVFGIVLAQALSEADEQRRRLREQAARVSGELESARRIQMGLLPAPRALFAREQRFAIDALLEPARTVGGDFYDCFMVDSERLFFIVADVSGKGLPASLFMALSKTLLKSAARRGGDVGGLMVRANAEVSSENPESLFVTAFAGLLDARTGMLQFCNAGHEPPFARAPGGALERLVHAGGPPLCVMENYAYPIEHRALAAGEWICLVTDGVTEAMNAAGELYGAARLRSVLEALPAGVGPSELLAAVRADVGRFVGAAEASDDLTLLCVRWNGTAALPAGPDDSADVDLDAPVPGLGDVVVGRH
ncbi:MAG TPA: CHASE2 domain-containing protein [Burkholderiales bacterium]|nr:CHASE2 domain-containing protein [Burkholderiales bacterium]